MSNLEEELKDTQAQIVMRREIYGTRFAAGILDVLKQIEQSNKKSLSLSEQEALYKRVASFNVKGKAFSEFQKNQYELGKSEDILEGINGRTTGRKRVSIGEIIRNVSRGPAYSLAVSEIPKIRQEAVAFSQIPKDIFALPGKVGKNIQEHGFVDYLVAKNYLTAQSGASGDELFLSSVGNDMYRSMISSVRDSVLGRI